MALTKHVVVYGSYTLPAPVDLYTFTSDGKTFEFMQPFIVTAADAASFKTAVDTAEAACQLANQTLTVTWNGQTIYSLVPGSNTALVVRAKLQKLGSQADLQLSRKYTLTVSGTLPASSIYSGSTTGIADFTIYQTRSSTTLSTYRFTGQVTAYSASGAVANVTSNLETALRTWLVSYGSPVEVASGANYYPKYEITNETYNWEDQNDTCQFDVTFRYRVLDEKAAAPYTDTKFTIEECRWSLVGLDEIGYHPGFQPELPVMYSVSFSVNVDNTQTDYESLRTLYYGTLKSVLLDKLSEIVTYGSDDYSGAWVVLSEKVNLIANASTISANYEIMSPSSTRKLAAFSSEIKYTIDHRQSLIRRAENIPHTYDQMTPGDKMTATQTITGTVINANYINQNQIASEINRYSLPGANWIPLIDAYSIIPFIRLSPTGATIKCYKFMVVRELQYAVVEGYTPPDIPDAPGQEVYTEG